MYTRRSFLKTLGAMGAASALPSFAAHPFSLGVASGYPSPDGVVLWTRLGGNLDLLAMRVRWEIASDESMRSTVISGETLAEPDWGHSIHVDAKGLAPDRWYWYRFMAAGAESPIGHKVALRDYKPGDTVIKYGVDIGKVVQPISKGEHLHVHNVKTKRW